MPEPAAIRALLHHSKRENVAKKVLFVCVHNSGRSLMAEAFFNALAQGRGTATSAGTEPGPGPNPAVVDAMAEVGLDVSGHQPRLLSQEMADQADLTVTVCSIDEACPVVFGAVEHWELRDPAGQPAEKVRQIRDQVRVRAEQLLKELF